MENIETIKAELQNNRGLRITAAYFLMLKELGYTEEEITEANEELAYILNQTISSINMMMSKQ